jgi:Tfp pilus assembly protein PilN
MRRVNLLPAHLLDAQRRQRQQATGVLLIGVVTVLLASWLAVAVWQVRTLEARTAAVDQQLQPLRQQQQHQARLLQQKQELAQRLSLIQTLREPVPVPAILARISQLAPPQAILRSMVIDVPAAPLAPAAPVAASSRRAAANQQPQPIRPIQIQLDGLASQDAAIARLVSELTESGLFQNVRLADSREMTFQGQPCHQFRVSMEISAAPGALARISSSNGLAQR